MRWLIAAILMLATLGGLGAQVRDVGLLPLQREKLEQIKSPERRLNKYKKYIHKDSVRYLKQLDNYWKRQSDSISTSYRKVRKSAQIKGQELAGRATDPVQRLRVSGLITEDMFRLPPDLELRLDPKHLRGFYTAFKNYLFECAKDTTEILRIKMPAALAEKSSKLKGFAGDKIPSVDSQLQKARGVSDQVIGQAKYKLTNNELVKNGLELKGKAGEYAQEFEKYKKYGDMSPDSLRGLAMARAESVVQQKMLEKVDLGDLQKNMAELDKMKALGRQYNDQMASLMDSSKRKEMMRQKAEELAMGYMEQNPAILQSAQKKMSLLMKKYSFLPNSNDLSTAVKRTSLQGRTFRERMVYALNFQLLSIEPVSVDFSPMLGYRFNTQFYAGGGVTYRQTFSDSIPTLAPSVWGYKAFASYEVVKAFFAYSEFARNSPGVEIIEGVSKRIWKPAAFLGIGRKFSIHQKVDMTTIALYNFLWKPGDPIYPRPFMIRVGFQLSEIALLKKRPEFKF